MTAVSTAHSAMGRCKSCETASVSTAAVVLRTHSRSSASWLALHARSRLQPVAKWLMPSSRGDDVGRVAANGAQLLIPIERVSSNAPGPTLERQVCRKVLPCRARADTSELHLSL